MFALAATLVVAHAVSFGARSYAPGDVAHLRGASGVVDIYRAGAGRDGPMQGARLGATRPGADVRIGNWPSGLYYARCGGFVAPFIVRPHRLGGHRVLVVLPTNTWQAYNFTD